LIGILDRTLRGAVFLCLFMQDILFVPAFLLIFHNGLLNKMQKGLENNT
jgi:hypothetical protein